MLAICLLSCSCHKREDCKKSTDCLENDIKPIDFENYNYASSVYWHYYGYCEEFNLNQEDSVKVYGQLTEYSLPNGKFVLHSRPSGGCWDKYIVVNFPIDEASNFALRLENISFPVKCYLSGIIRLSCWGDVCPKVKAELYVKSINDIYFE
jgi:hypothetical protein